MALVKKLQWNKNLLVTAADDFKAALDSLEETPTPSEIENIRVQLEGFSSAYTEFQEIASELFDLEIDITKEHRTFRTNYYEIVGRAKLIIGKTASLPSSSASQCSTSKSSAGIVESPQVRLPVIEIPTFTGKYDEWPSFCDSFTSLIHSNQSLSNIQRFHYLQSALKGEAASILKSLKLSDAGYTLAWQRLQERYQNERFIVKQHVQELLNLVPVKRDNHASLRQLVDTVAINLASLKSIGRPTDTWSDIIIELVSEKLDSNLQKEWEGRTCDAIPTYGEMEKFLTSKCKQLEAIRINHSNSSEMKSSKPTKTFVARSENKCVICNKRDHSTGAVNFANSV